MKRKLIQKEYVVYKGDTFICMGTEKECAEFMGVKDATFRFYSSQAYAKRIANRKHKSCGYITVIEVEDDDETEF